MSATFGSGGELERITGIGGIKRIPTPKTSPELELLLMQLLSQL
jgi:hypothetical protein